MEIRENSKEKCENVKFLSEIEEMIQNSKGEVHEIDTSKTVGVEKIGVFICKVLR